MFIFECKPESGSVKAFIKIGLMLFVIFVATHSRADFNLTDDEIAVVLIQESIRNYSVNVHALTI